MARGEVVLGGGPLLFWEIEERQGLQKFSCLSRASPKVQGFEISQMCRTLEQVLHRVLPLSAARTEVAGGEADALTVVLKCGTETRPQLR